MMDEPIGVGIVGYGAAARGLHIPLINANNELELRALATSRPQVAEADMPTVHVVANVEEMCARDDLDLVVIAGRNIDHFPVARQALMSNKHVVIEKPMTVTTKDADELIEIAHARKKSLNVFQNRRWDNGILALERLLDEGTLGDISVCSFRYDRLAENPEVRWREDGTPGSGMTYDLGPHLIYAALTLFGLPDFLWADIATQRRDGVVDDYFDITLSFGSTRVHLQSSMLVANPDLTIETHGTRGSFRKFGLDPQVGMLRAGLTPADQEWRQHEGADYAEIATLDSKGSADTRRIALPPGSYDAFYSGITSAIKHGMEPPVPALRARNVIALIEAAFLSAKDGRRLSGDELGLVAEKPSS